MKVAVTGAAGFIGRHVLRELARHSVKVVAADLPQSNPIPAADEVEIVRLDIADSPDQAFGRLGGPDALIHLVWGGLPNYRSPHHMERELPMQQRFLEGLVRAGLPALVVTGTCFEYGMQSGRLSEDMETHPDNPYALAKDTLRRRLEDLRRHSPFAFAWTRLFYLYGDGQAANSLLPQLRRAVEQGEKAFNMSGGEQLRDYLPIADVARSIVMLALNKVDAGVVNICSGKPISVRQLVEGWLAENNWNIKLNLGHYPYPDYEPMEFWGDRGKLDKLLRNPAGFNPPARRNG